ncbi:hypothetical protein [Scytonema sp. NUACC26]|uniref:hypothetical protein n=1 Tax=Scytonema sp. NUACC26 TaxID=3140176 RepID=UPI0038B4053A
MKKKSEMEETAKRLVKERELLQQRIQQLEKENQHLRQQPKQLRNFPLEDIASKKEIKKFWQFE